MTTTKNNEHKKLNFSSEREQSQVCLNSAEHEKNQGRKVLNVPNLRFKEFQGEWEKCKLGDKCDLLCGYAFDGKDIVEQGTYLLMRGINITEGIIRHSAELDRYYTGSVNNLTKYKLTTGDLVIGMDGSKVGRNSAIVSPKENGSYLVQRVCRIKSCIGNDLILQLVNNHKFHKYVDMVKTSSAIPHISLKDIQNFPIAVPSVQKEADKISRLFHLLDERIATQNKIIEDLKKLKSAIIEIEYTPNTKTTSHIGNVIEQISKRNKNNAIQNVLSVSNRQGFIKQSDQFENRNVASEDTSNYKIVEKNDFAFNPARINVGSIARLTTFEKGIVSPMYICFRTQESVAPEYIDFFFESKHFYCEIQKRLEGSVRQCLSFEGLCNIPFSLPSLEMQQRIGKRLFTLGQKIKTETDLLELLNKQKQYLLRQIFI